MKFKIYHALTLLSIVTCLNQNNLSAQAADTWAAKTSLSTARRDAVGFAIGNKGYIGTGNSSASQLDDFWEFNPATNTWTQKATVPGGTRAGSMGFGIGTKGYIGGGYNSSTGLYITGFYEYDVAGNTWTAKANIPGIGNEESVSFTIGSKGYYGTGFNSNTPPYCVANFYEYDPSNNTWTAKSSFPGNRYGSIGFAIGSKGYMGSGSNCVTGDVSSFYEFDPIANTWTARANHPGPVRESGTGFSVGGKGYLANGRNSTAMYNDLYEYDPTTNAWAVKATPLGGARLGGVAFGIGSKGYIATGYNFNFGGAAAFMNDVYEYTPCPLVGGLTISPATAALVCNGSGTVSVASTQTNAIYYLRNDANNAVVASAAGTGGTVVFNTGNISAATTFNINAATTTGGLTFSGAAQYVLISTPHSSTGNFTWETWFKTSGNGVLFSIVLPSGTYAAAGSKVLYINSGTISLDCYNLGSLQSAGNNYADNAWHHVALTVQSNFSSTLDKITIYADGVQAAQGLFDMNSGTETGLVNKIGYATSDASNSLPGTVDEVRIWNTTRTAAEVAGDMSNCLTGTETGLVGYYQFENGTGSTTVTDVAGGNNNGTLTNMNATTAWTTGRDNCGICSQQQATKPVFSIGALTNQAPAPLASTVICNGGAAISFSTQTGVNYYLRNDANNAVLSGPVAGTGGTVALASGNVTASSTLNVLGKKLSGGLTFDGANDRVTIPYSAAFNFSTNIDFTYEAMIKFTASQPNYAGIICKANGSAPFSQMVIYNNRIAAEVFTSGNLGVGNGLVGTTALNDGKWHHVAMVVTRSTNNIKLYVDGVVEANITNAIIGGNLNEIVGFNIGSDRAAGTFFNGSIDEARAWNTARSVSQLTANASACLTGTETGLLAYYQFEDGVNSILATDLTSNNNTGFLVNMNTATAWTSGVENCGCSSQMTAKPTIVVNAIANQSVTAALTNICGSGSTTINSAGSEAGINYYLRDNSTNSVVTGPVVGTGSALSFTTSNLTATKTYNVLAKKITGGLTFDGVNDYITTPLVPAFNFAGDFAMETWMQSPLGANPGTRVIIGMPGGSDCWLGLTNNGYPSFISAGNSLAGTAAINDGKWHHLAAVRQAGIKYLYVDGVLAASVANTGAISLNSDIEIGGYNGSYNFDGQIDEVRVFNSALTQAQVATSMTACATGSETGLLLYYNFEEGTGSASVTDIAGMDNNGTLTNMAIITAWGLGVENCGCTLQMANTPTVNINAIPTISANSATICSGNSVAIVPTGASTYTITGGSFTVTPGVTTSYSVTGTSSNNCAASNTAVISVSVNATPTLAVNNATICSGATVTLTPTGAGTYTITGNTFTVTPGITTSYSVTGTGTNNCAAGNTIVSTVSVNATPTLAVNSATICSNSSVAIVPTGAGTYTITGGTFTVSPNVTTSYSVTGTGTNNCAASNTIVSTVSVNATPTLAVNNATICSGNSVAIVPTGAGTYTISGASFTVSPTTNTSYSVTGTGTNNCAAGNTIVSTVSVNTTPTVIASSGTICSGNSYSIVATGAAVLAITGGTFNVSPTANASYTVTGTNPGNCTNSVVATVSVNTTPTVVASSGTICSGTAYSIVATGAPVLAITGGTFNVSPTANASYTVTGTNPGNCTVIVVATVSVNASPTVVASSGTICSGSSYSIAATGAPVLAITGGTFNVSPAATAAYTVTGTNPGNCTATAVSNVTVSATPTVVVPSYSICTAGTATIVPTGAGSGGSYSINPGVNNFTVSPSATANYSVTATNSANCVSSAVVSTVTVLSNVTLTVLSNTTICAGTSVVIVPTGASTYTITGGTFTVSPTTTTSYSITGFVASCASATQAVINVSVNANPTVSATSGTICSGNSYSIVATGTAAPTITITGGNFNVSPTANTAYTVTGVSANGCTATAVSNVSVNASPTLVVSSGSICSGNSYSISATGAPTLAITGGTFNVSPATNTTYVVTGTVVNGCTATAVANVSVTATPTIVVPNYTICLGKSATITPTGATYYVINGFTGGTYLASPSANASYTMNGISANGCPSSNTATSVVTVVANPTIAASSGIACSASAYSIVASGAPALAITGGTFNVTPLVNTNYTVTGTALNGCTAIAVSNVTAVASPTITVPNYTVCFTKTVTVTASGAGTGGTYTINGVTGNGYSNLPSASTTFTVAGTNSLGCLSANVATTAVTVNTLPVIALPVTNTTICSGGTVNIPPTGAGTGGTYTITPGTSFNPTPITNTTYSITGTQNGCVSSNTAVITVSVNASPTIVVNSGGVCLNSNYTIAPAGANTYTMNSSGTFTASGNNFLINPTVTTTYSVTGTGTNNCLSTVTGVATITISPLPVVTINSGDICPNNAFTFVATGANTYTYTGSTGTVSTTFSPTASGVYSVTGTSALGCISSNVATSTVNVINTVTISVFGNMEICKGDNTDLSANGATNYSWSTGAATSTVNVSPTANTSYTVTGSTGNCTNTAVVNITVNALPVVTVTGGSICKGKSFTITPSGASSYVYSTGNAVITPTGNVNFSVTGTSIAGCTSTNAAVGTVTVNELPNITVSTTIICVGETATLTATGGTAYAWNTGGSNASIMVTPTVNTNYTVTGTDANGCSKSVFVMQITDLCVGIAKQNNATLIFGVYPNPNSGEFIVEAQENIEVFVLNALGQVVHTERTTGSKTNISISHLAHGIYFVKAIANGSQQVVKLIKE